MCHDRDITFILSRTISDRLRHSVMDIQMFHVLDLLIDKGQSYAIRSVTCFPTKLCGTSYVVIALLSAELRPLKLSTLTLAF
jgi:hypothetical protein